MKKLVFEVFAVSILFYGCYFSDSSKKTYDENIINVSSSGTYSVAQEFQAKDAYLVCYNDSSSEKKSSSDSFSWEETSSSYSDETLNYSRRANSVDSKDENKIAPIAPKRIDYISEPFDFDLIPATNSRTASTASLPDYTGEKAEFYLDEEYNNKKISAEKKVEGNYCRVWYYEDSSIKTPDDSIFNELAEWFDKIYPVETELLCSNVPTRSYSNIIDVTKSTKINILVYDLFDDYEKTAESNSGTYGFVAYKDMFTDENCSNKCEMFYIDTYFLAKEDSSGNIVLSQEMISTLAHEFQHMLGFIQKRLNYNLSYSTWYTEMLSMLTEEFFCEYLGIESSSGPEGRIPQYLSGNVYGFSSWNDSSSTVYYNYANAYAFGTYLTRNFGGIDLVQRIFRNKYFDKESVVRAVAENGYDYSFSELLALFSAVQVYVSDSSHISLYKSGSKTVGGGNLSYPKIDLRDFYSFLVSSDKETTFNNFLDTVYQASGVNSSYTTKDGTYLVYTGPIYYRKNPGVNVQPTGSYIVHLGNISEYTIERNSSLKYYILFK